MWILALLGFSGWAEEAVEGASGTVAVDLSTARWGEVGIAAAAKLDASSWEAPPVLAQGRRGAVATTSMAGTAARAGLEALRQGGSAVDAALVTALTQTVLNTGCWTSFAGLMSMVVYDADSGEVFTLEGGWNTVKDETYPLPPQARVGEPGRAVLVPGFMAAVQAAHDRFGVLPFAELFVPAIYFAEEGFELGALDFSPWGRLRADTTRAMGERMQSADWQQALRDALAGPPSDAPADHSDGVVAVDERGNVVALFHSINTSGWGTGGLFVDASRSPTPVTSRATPAPAPATASPTPAVPSWF